MISKKRRHKGLLKSAPPTTGRAAFKGILHPLILGGQSIAPSSTATTANFDPYSQATVTVPSDAEQPSQVKPACELTATEKAWCDIGSFSWCKKVGLTADDPKCIPNNIKCPPSQKWLDISKEPRSTYYDFTSEENIKNGINGMCVDEAIAETDAKANKAYDDWVNTRGCNLGSISDSTIHQSYKPCWPTFKDAEIGDIRPTVAGYANMRLLSWIPDRPLFVPYVAKS
jgi:hypothetical protein